MADFIGYIGDVLDISLTVGTVTLTLGGVALGVIILNAGVAFWKGLKGRR